MRRGLRSSALVLAAAVTLTSACGTNQAGAAAVVGERRITVNELQQATRQIEQYAGQQVAQQQVLFYLIAEPFIVDAAEKARVGVSEDDARRELVGKVASPAPATIEALRANRAISRLQGLEQARAQAAIQGVVAQITKAAPRVNPRYGTWDPTNLSIVETSQNWIQPAPGASPSPAASPEGGAPDGTAPDGTAPDGTAPEGGVPEGTPSPSATP